VSFQPLNNNVLVNRRGSAGETEGGIIIPEHAKQLELRGVVEAVGPGLVGPNGVRVAPGCKPGDMVIFSRHGGTDVNIPGLGKRLLIAETQIFGVFREESATRIVTG